VAEGGKRPVPSRSFFERQAQARAASRRLLWLLVPAMLGMLVVANVAAFVAWLIVRLFLLSDLLPFWPPLWFPVVVTVVTTWFVALGTWDSMALVSQGGAAVARYLGAREVDARSTDLDEQRLRNVAEEMAIASGMPVPALYIMDHETAVNAFAAGSGPGDTVVVVTRGALAELRRDELQGMIAHEYSHILNGDIALNMRLFGLLGGILRIWLKGQALHDRDERSAERQREQGLEPRGNLFVVVAGSLLKWVGAAGHWGAGSVSAAVSREREHLADACAVQYTRDPDGVAGALVKLGASGARGRIGHPHAEHASFMFFGEVLPLARVTRFATHPPVAERLSNIYGRRVSFGEAENRLRDRPERAQAHAPASAVRADPAAAAASVGGVEPAQLDYAASLLQGMPASLREAVRTPQGAVAAMLALALAPAGDTRDAQLALLGEQAGPAALAHAMIEPLGRRARLPLVDLAVPALRALDAGAKRDFLARFDALIAADRRVTLEEFVLETLLRAVLAGPDAPGTAPGAPLDALREECALLLSLAAHAGGAAAVPSFERAAADSGLRLALVPAQAIRLESVRAAIARLRGLHSLQKPRLLKALAQIALADGNATDAEVELLRAISASLDCPMPPILPRAAA
jgi:Zn-dependent protease with chaperone function